MSNLKDAFTDTKKEAWLSYSGYNERNIFMLHQVKRAGAGAENYDQ